MKLQKLLDRIRRKASGYILAYDPRGETQYACRAWFGDEEVWFHGYGDNEQEAVEDCLDQLEKWWDVRVEINVGSGLSRRWEGNEQETEEETNTET